MTTANQNYGLFLKFFDAYAPVGFKGMDPADPLIVEIENMMETNDQFFYVGDLPKMEILFVSKRSAQMMGIQPKDLQPNHFLEAVHPDDFKKASLGRVKLFKMAHHVSLEKTGFSLMSSNFRMRNAQGKYSNFLFQLFVFYSKLPYESAFLIKVHTNIDWCRKMKYGFHYYSGNDLSYFRYPDENLLMAGIPFTNREFEIMSLVATGLHTKEIAAKLFISPETVNTHRRNIIKKSDKATLSDVIYDLIEKGVLL
jgi:hypothetical protein